MENKTKTLIAETKAILKTLVKDDSTVEQVDTLTAIDKKLDEIIVENENLSSENVGLKDKLINYVKNTSFKTSNEEHDIGLHDEPKSLDDILTEGLNKYAKQEDLKLWQNYHSLN